MAFLSATTQQPMQGSLHAVEQLSSQFRPDALPSSQPLPGGCGSTAGERLKAMAKGGYILEDSIGAPEIILIGTGTELKLCTNAAAQLRAEDKNVRVVSMPAAYHKRLVVEASSSFGWHK
jgi:transketolase